MAEDWCCRSDEKLTTKPNPRRTATSSTDPNASKRSRRCFSPTESDKFPTYSFVDMFLLDEYVLGMGT